MALRSHQRIGCHRPIGWARAVALLMLLAAPLACGPTQPPPVAPPNADGAPPGGHQAPAGTPTDAAPSSPPAATAAPTAPAPAPKLNVVVIFIDAMRADMPWAGYPRDIAPNLTALEKQSVSYTRAYALSSYTAMSNAGFLAGRYPGELKRSGYFFSAYPDDELFFPELLQPAGVRTLAAHAHFYFEQKAGFHQGFDDYRVLPELDANNTTDKNVTSPQHVALARQMLSDEANTGGQFFAWFHFMDPHDRYVTHEGFTKWGTGQRDRYDGEMAFTDHHVGKLLSFIDSQPWGKHTVLVVTGDHGEAFGEHQRTRHGFELWEPLVRVPLFIKVPGVAPKRIDTPRGHVDLAPTILELMGVAAHPAFQGKSLVAEMKGTAEPEPREVIVDLPRTSDNFRRRALIWGRHKILAFGDDFRFKVFDVVADPGEQQDLRRRDKDLYEQLKQRYREKVKTIKDICPANTKKLKGKRPENPC